MQATESIVKLFTEWEIQLLVLLSFTLQLFLFFAGSLRRCSYSVFLRVCNWIAYLGADFVAVYALGYLSRHNQDETRGTEPLAFFWAPFLLIHLGGQDTITALSMEDNNLWLRHLLNLVVQVVLALHVFWKSIGRLKNVELLASGVLVFVAGIIKYVERIWCLKHGRLADLASTNEKHEGYDGRDAGGYASLVIGTVKRMQLPIRIFGSSENSYYINSTNGMGSPENIDAVVKALRLFLGLMYDELYTKARVLRTWSFMIFRLISQISFVAAFAVFHSSIAVDRQQQQGRYVKADVAITYSLFIGGVFVEVCSVLNSMMSPWTWKMLKDRQWEKLARLSWLILSSDIGWPEKKQRWPCSFGQYNFLSWLRDGHPPQQARRTFCQGVMAVVRRAFVDVMGVNRKKLFWMSKVLDTWYIEADQAVIDKYVVREIMRLSKEHRLITPSREWPNLAPVLMYGAENWAENFGAAIAGMHVLTELHLRSYDDHMAAEDDEEAFGLAQICRKLSNYMMHLLVSNPSMLPLTMSSEHVLETFHRPGAHLVWGMGNHEELHPSKETVEEMIYMWTRILIYAAGKSQPAVHASQLASSGGELITLTWLLMVLYQIGDYLDTRVDIFRPSVIDRRDVYAFDMHARTNQHAAGSSDQNPTS